MQRTHFDSMPCPIARAIEHLSDGWNALILREAFYGVSRFDEFEQKLGIASNTLTRRLKDMVAGGLLDRRRYQDHPPRFEYVLTEKGRDLRPVMLTLLAWGNKHTLAPDASVRLVDTATGNAVQLQLIDALTGLPIGAQHRVLRRVDEEHRQTSHSFPDSAHS